MRHDELAVAALLAFIAGPVAGQDAEGGGAPDYFARDTFRIDPLVCPFKGRIDYEPGEIECGLLQVPENREKPGSRYIELHFIKLASTWDDEEAAEAEDEDEAEGPVLAPGRRDDPVVYLTGGPGAHAELYVERFKDHGIRKHRDLYILEQRGIATSADFCVNYFTRKPETFNVDSLAAQAEAQLTAAGDCALNALAAGVDLSAYNTIENARDVRAFRRALGFEHWNVWGISYGSILGQAYIKEDPDGIRAIVLDAIVPLDTRADPTFWRIINWYDRDLKKLDELCQADPDCADEYPDLGERVRDAARATMDKPIVVDVEDTERYPSGKAYFLSDIAAFLPFTLFYEQSNYPALPGIIYEWQRAIDARDELLFKAAAIAPNDFFGISQGMYNAIMCNDGHAEAQILSVDADRREFPVLTNAFDVEGSAARFAERCVDLGMPPRDRAAYALVETDIPALLVEGDMDPITPPPLAHAIAPGFSNATYVEFPYAGHGPSRSVECAGDMLNAFYDDPRAEPDLSCVEEMEAPEFIVPVYATRLLPKLILLAESPGKKTLALVGAWAGAASLLVLVGFIVLSIAPLGRRIDRRSAVGTDGARIAAWAAATLATAAIAILGAAAAVSYETSEMLLLFGMVSWARFGAWAGVLAGLAGIAALVLTIRARLRRPLPIGTLAGFLLTGAGAVALAAFLLYADLGP